MQTKVNDIQSSSAQSIRNDRRAAGGNSRSELSVNRFHSCARSGSTMNDEPAKLGRRQATPDLREFAPGATCPAGSPAQRDAGPNSHNQPSLTKGPLPAFSAMQDNSKKQEDICPTCGKNRRREAVICGVKYSFHVMCKCEEEQEKAAKERRENLDKMRKIEKLKSLSLLGERYKTVTFSTTKTGINSSFDTAFNRCKKYCELYEDTIKNGCGIYLFGDKGVGKTHLTACMANFLLSKCVPVLFTNLFEISKAVKSTFSRESSQTEQILIQKFSNIDVLFFDDLGTEIFTKSSGETWLQGLLFDLINKRYNNQKATIFSSNYSLNSLINERGIMEKTVDRISQMTSGAVMKIEGRSLRNALKNQSIF